MAEEQNKEKPKEEQPQEQEKPQEQEEPEILTKANKTLEGLKSENQRMESNIKKLEEMKAHEALGGKSEGKPQEEKPQEESPEDYSEKALQGDIKQEE